MRRAAIFLAATAALGAAALGALVLTLWFSPQTVIDAAARLAKSRGVLLHAEAVHGTPVAGWTFDGLAVRVPAADVSIRRLRLDVDWLSTFRGRPALDVLWIDGLRVVTKPTPPKAKPPAADDGPPALVAIDDLRLSDGAVTVDKGEGEPLRLTRLSLSAALTREEVRVRSLEARAFGNSVQAAGRFAPAAREGAVRARVLGCAKIPGVASDRCVRDLSVRAAMKGEEITVENLSAIVEGSTVAGRGKLTLSPFEGRFKLASRGPLALKAAFTAEGKKWTVQATGAKDTSRLELNASVDLAAKTWNGRLAAIGVPADLVPGLPPTLGALSGTVAGEGRGTAPAEMTGKGTLSLNASNGPRLNGRFDVQAGDARADLKISSGGVNGKVDARWNFAKKSGEAAVDAALDAPGLRAWLPAGADGAVKAAVRGPQARLSWNASAKLNDVVAPGVTAGALTFRGEGPSLAPAEGKAELAIADLKSGSQALESVKLTLDGTENAHAFTVALARNGAAIDAAGRGALAGGVWRSTWTKLDAAVEERWSLQKPFRLSAGPRASRLSGFRLASSSGTVAMDGALVRGRLQGVVLNARGLQLGGLTKLAGLEQKVAGIVSVDLQAAGPLARPAGRAAVSVAGLSIDGRPAGDLNAVAEAGAGRVAIEKLELLSAGGKIFVTGDLPMSFAGKKVPPFTLRVRTAGLDPAALPVPTGGAQFDKALLKADLTVSGRGGIFSASGHLSFDANKIAMEDGPEVEAVRVRLSADGQTLTVKEATAKGGRGLLTVTGSVAAQRMNLALQARGFEVRHPSGVYVRFDSDATLGGRWEAPRVEGRVDIREGEIKPAKKDKKKDKKKAPPPAPKAPAAPEPASPLEARVTIAFDRDVWYKDGQSSIELKGNLEMRKDAGQPALIFGTIETIRGEYIFYGRAFVLETGRVTFTGEAPPDPRLQVRALHTSKTNVKVWIDATGRLRDPRIALSSQPPMEETDIVSVLVTGAPRGAAGESAGTEAAARTMAANYLAEQVRQRVQDKFAVDVLRFNLGEGGNADVTIGENVTDDLYVSYGQTLGEAAERRLSAEYELTPRFALHGTTSTLGRYVLDLLFKFGFY